MRTPSATKYFLCTFLSVSLSGQAWAAEARTQPASAVNAGEPALVVAQPPSEAQPQQGDLEQPPNASMPSSGPEQPQAGYVVTPPPVVVATTPHTPAPQPARVRHPGRGMLIAGWTTLGSSYLLSMMVGTAVYDSELYEDEEGIDPETAEDLELHIPKSRRHAYGRAMFIPIVGPFIAASKTKSASMGLATSLLGTAQVTGLVLGVVGSIRYANARSGPRYQVSYAPVDDGGVATLSGRF